MLRAIPKANIHPVERYAAALGAMILSIGAGAAASLGPRFALAVVTLGVVAGLWLAALPGVRLRYFLTDQALHAGRRRLRFADMADARVVSLRGVFMLFGLTLPGYWAGRAWSHRLGRFDMLGSTGLSRGVLVTMTDGRRLVLTPSDPVDLVVRLRVHGYAAQRVSILKRPKSH